MLKKTGLFLAALLATSAGLAHAQSVTGLGQEWPNAADVSTSPNYHVYVFQRGTLHYIQVNDASGKVRGAFARSAFGISGLPVGTDAQTLATPDEPQPAPASTSGETVYQDSSIKIFAAPQATGELRLMAVPSDCKNPVECSSKSP